MAAPAQAAAQAAKSTSAQAPSVTAKGSHLSKALSNSSLGLVSVERKVLKRTSLGKRDDRTQELLKGAQEAMRHEELTGKINTAAAAAEARAAAAEKEAEARQKALESSLEEMNKQMKKNIFGLAHTMRKQGDAVKGAVEVLEQKIKKEVDAARKAQMKASQENMVKLQIKMTGIQEQILKDSQAKERQVEELKEQLEEQSKKQNAASKRRAGELKAQIEELGRQNEENQRKLERELAENRRQFEEQVGDLGAEVKGKMDVNQAEINARFKEVEEMNRRMMEENKRYREEEEAYRKEREAKSKLEAEETIRKELDAKLRAIDEDLERKKKEAQERKEKAEAAAEAAAAAAAAEKDAKERARLEAIHKRSVEEARRAGEEAARAAAAAQAEAARAAAEAEAAATADAAAAAAAEKKKWKKYSICSGCGGTCVSTDYAACLRISGVKARDASAGKGSSSILFEGYDDDIAALVAMNIGISIKNTFGGGIPLINVAPGSQFHGEWEAERRRGVSMEQATYNLMQRYLSQVRGAKGMKAL
jgi:hypothetical protein